MGHVSLSFDNNADHINPLGLSKGSIVAQLHDIYMPLNET